MHLKKRVSELHIPEANLISRKKTFRLCNLKANHIKLSDYIIYN